MKKVSKSELKAKMFEHFRAIEKDGEALIVTAYGKPVLKILSIKEDLLLSDIFSDLKGKVKLDRAAILEPTTDEWTED